MGRRVWLSLVPVLALLLAACTMGGLRKGEVAPDFALEDLSGKQVRLSDFRGRPVLVNFWASWCAPCQEEMPELQAVYSAQGDDGLVILAVNTLYQDKMSDVRAMASSLELTFPILLDGEGTVSSLYRASSFPTSVFVDREGQIYLVQVGSMNRRFMESVLHELP